MAVAAAYRSRPSCRDVWFACCDLRWSRCLSLRGRAGRATHGLCRQGSPRLHFHAAVRLLVARVDRPGVLACLDGFMNIAMEQTEEYVNSQLKNKYGDCFIRGNNGMC